MNPFVDFGALLCLAKRFCSSQPCGPDPQRAAEKGTTIAHNCPQLSNASRIEGRGRPSGWCHQPGRQLESKKEARKHKPGQWHKTLVAVPRLNSEGYGKRVIGCNSPWWWGLTDKAAGSNIRLRNLGLMNHRPLYLIQSHALYRIDQTVQLAAESVPAIRGGRHGGSDFRRFVSPHVCTVDMRYGRQTVRRI